MHLSLIQSDATIHLVKDYMVKFKQLTKEKI